MAQLPENMLSQGFPPVADWYLNLRKDRGFREFLKEVAMWVLTDHHSSFLGLHDTLDLRDTFYDSTRFGNVKVALDVTALYSIYKAMSPEEAVKVLSQGLEVASFRTWFVARFRTEWEQH